jgi:uncharacterized protein YukE
MIVAPMIDEASMPPGERSAYANGFAAGRDEIEQLRADTRAEIERLQERIERMRAFAEDEQRKRHHAEEQLMDARSEIARLQTNASSSPI